MNKTGNDILERNNLSKQFQTVNSEKTKTKLERTNLKKVSSGKEKQFWTGTSETNQLLNEQSETHIKNMEQLKGVNSVKEKSETLLFEANS